MKHDPIRRDAERHGHAAAHPEERSLPPRHLAAHAATSERNATIDIRKAAIAREFAARGICRTEVPHG